jgi:hypothetical protein
MFGETSRLCELLATAQTLELPLSCVDRHVLVKLGLDGKGFGTDWAPKPMHSRAALEI